MTIGALLLVSLVSSIAGFLTGIFAETLDQVNRVSSFVLTPLIYLGGSFYSVSALPLWAQQLSLANPTLYIVNLFRYAMFGISDVNLGVSMSVMCLAALAMLATAAILLDRGVGIRE